MKTSHMNFNQEYTEDAPTLAQISELDGNTLLEFGTPWCGHCQAAQAAVQKVLREYSTLRYIKVYDGKGKPLGRAFGLNFGQL